MGYFVEEVEKTLLYSKVARKSPCLKLSRLMIIILFI